MTGRLRGTGRRRGTMMILYALSIFASALLLFLIQPLIGKVILPWFGGSSAVWSASMLFFQLLLLLGYIYAHVLVRRSARRRQVLIHLGLMVASLIWLGINLLSWQTPITPDFSTGAWWMRVGGDHRSSIVPLAQVLLTLAVSVGAPYLVLSATSPLLQAWFAAQFPEDDPYPLYALSNVGSLLALLGYPFLLETSLTLSDQGVAWSIGYLVFALGLATVAESTLRRPRMDPPEKAVAAHEVSQGRRLRWWHPVMWLAFSTVASVLLLGTTNQITQNVASVPLLWIGPLVLYLLTFVIAFSGKAGYGRWALLLLFVATQIFGYLYPRGNIFPARVQLAAYGFLLFAGCMVSHGELARLRPGPRHLTSFYLMIAVGGALGGVLVNLVAPLIFNATWEFPIALLICWILAGLAVSLDTHSPIARRRALQSVLVVVFAIGILASVGVIRSSLRGIRAATVAAERNFYGVLWIQRTTLAAPEPVADGTHDAVATAPEQRAAYQMVHGTTIHGVQYAAPELREIPTSYFGPSSGVGRVLNQAQAAGEPLNIGVLGLGVGTLATYGREGDTVRLYEIDPDVIDYASGRGGYFSYLSETAAEVAVVPGDARLSLQTELELSGGQAYDVLAIDVFSGDAPPVHLLTLEAFELYLAHLAPDGLLAVNISTTHLDLAAVIAGLAQHLELEGVIVRDMGDGGACFPSRWVVLARDPDLLSGPHWDDTPDLETSLDPALRLWTDDYSNLVDILW